MNKKKQYKQMIKRNVRPEVTRCLECQSKLQRCVTIADRMIITLEQVIRSVHCGYRCPQAACPGRKELYRSAQADALALPVDYLASLEIRWEQTSGTGLLSP